MRFFTAPIKQSTGLFGFRWVRIPISVNKKDHPFGRSSSRMDEGFDCQFAVGKLYGIDQCLHWSIKQSTGLFGFRWVRIPSRMLKNARSHKRSGVFWQRMRDSNPRKRSQSPVCYRYTNPLSLWTIWLAASSGRNLSITARVRSELSAATRRWWRQQDSNL